jgi:multidrug resistance efflux pump
VFDPRQTLEAEAAQAALTAAEAEARLAGATLERYERLARHDNITRAVLDEARTRLEAAQAQVQAARRRYAAILDGLRAEYAGLWAAQARIAEARAAVALAQKAVEDTTVRAPFAGYVAERFASMGEHATPEKPLMELVVLERLKLELQMPAGEAGRVRRGRRSKPQPTPIPTGSFVARSRRFARWWKLMRAVCAWRSSCRIGSSGCVRGCSSRRGCCCRSVRRG